MSVDAELVEAVARRVVELLREEGLAEPKLWPAVMTTKQVAERLGRSQDWVRAHRYELGLIPGYSDRPRLMFDALAVRRWIHTEPERRRARRLAIEEPQRRARTTRTKSVDLLPIDGPIIPRPGER